MNSKHICLNMIVKDEESVIERCLESVVSVIDSWVIVDTGSTDRTKEIIENFFREKKIPGVLLEQEWVNFGHNRQAALDSVNSEDVDYVLFMDADDQYVADTVNLRDLELVSDAYYINMHLEDINYDLVKLIRKELPWEWKGCLHEYLQLDGSFTTDTIKGVYIQAGVEGCRSKNPDKYLNDAKLLELEILKDPLNTRNWFYLAQSYRDAEVLHEARRCYDKRISLGGWAEEVYYSLLMEATLAEEMGAVDDYIVSAYLRAYDYRPTRAEPLYWLADFFSRTGRVNLRDLFYTKAKSMPLTKDLLFVQPFCYSD